MPRVNNTRLRRSGIRKILAIFSNIKSVPQGQCPHLSCRFVRTEPLGKAYLKASFYRTPGTAPRVISAVLTVSLSLPANGKKRSKGFAHLFRPMYAGANMGHPSDFLQPLQ